MKTSYVLIHREPRT